MADEAANAQGDQAARPTRRSALLRRAPWALVVSATLSIVFVVLVGTIIAFMQFQSRLQRAQPGITASQLVYFVDTEKGIERNVKALTDLSQTIAKVASMYGYVGNEISFRIERACALLDEDLEAGKDGQRSEVKKDVENCRRFLNQIPFEGTAKPNGVPEVPSEPMAIVMALTDKPPPVMAISDELLDSIMANFTKITGEKKIWNTDKKLTSILRSDVAVIARLNQTYWLYARPRYLYGLQDYRATCWNLIKQITNVVSTYRSMDPGCDPYLDASALFAPASTPAPRTGTQPPAPPPDTPPAGGAANQPINSGQAPSAGTPPARPAGLRPDSAPGPAGAAAGTTATVPPGPPPPRPSGSPPVVPPEALPGPPPGDTVRGGAIFQTAPTLLSAADRQRAFELVTHYRFYDSLTLEKLRNILISPNDFLALVLVGVGGVLGALLRIVFASYISGKDPTARSILISPILGLICSLVVYNLFRAGFIVITDQPQSSETAALSPFVVALLAIASGLLSERTIEFFRKTSGNWFGGLEASEAARWAVNLQREMEAQATTPEKLAERLDVSAAKLKDWALEKEPVPVDKQRDIAFALNVPLRRIFTDIEPVRAG